MPLHIVAPSDFADTFPAAHERQLLCPPWGWYFPLGHLGQLPTAATVTELLKLPW